MCGRAFKDWKEYHQERYGLTAEQAVATYCNTDSCQLITAFNVENVTITGVHLTRSGRTCMFKNGNIGMSHGERGLDLNLHLVSTNKKLVSNTASLITSFSNTHETLKMAAGSPMILLPEAMYDKMKLLRYPPKSWSRSNERQNRGNMADIYHPRY